MRFLMLGILLGFPLAEAVVMYMIGQNNLYWLAAWLILAAVIGVVLIKEARFALVARLAAALAQGRFSLSALIDSGRTVLAGLLLIFPGIISDVMALLLLLLPIRTQELELHPIHAGGGGGATRGNAGGVIDGEFRRES
jgi:UPF0716 protein FxsA